ncbi:sensor histidine kinase [Sporanaerobacter acetigenes]|uniref:histidine kinase n=2 Tax=Sporanaerobacter acetigenes TaxID=165813 RepID=A0A1M5Z6Q9_9FIRM|nr:HAMP domain-containing sensor histidine kinase [Sporanaerobacter acetigenes]SHI19909.1 Signal transduction histidine kinase [Sporanaerobacter acetigenes DSM 13106]
MKIKRRKKVKKLKLSLFLIPSSVILIAFCLILATFNILIHQHIEKLTAKEINREFEFYDIYYYGSNYLNNHQNDGNDKNDAEFFITVYYAILDENYNALIPNDQLYSELEQERIQVIAKYFRENRNIISKDQAIMLKHDCNTFYIKPKVYHGKSDGYCVLKDTSHEAKDFTVIVYANITPMQNFVDLIHKILGLLMILSGIVSIFVILRMTKKIDNSFNKLKKYIIDVGERKVLEELDVLDYREFNDVAKTVQKMSKMIDQAEESQKQFFQNASHELRTPLTSIQGYAEAIESGVIKDNKKSASIIINESKKMSSLVDEILFLSRMDMDHRKMNQEIIELKELIYDCSWRIKGNADKRNLNIEHVFLEDNAYIFGDEQRLERAFLNVISNAIRYAKTTIKIICEGKEKNIVISIIDDGNGISNKDLPHIFERFYKGEDGNFGIGLSITREIINEHGGNIDVISQKGNTKFVISIPKYKWKNFA